MNEAINRENRHRGDAEGAEFGKNFQPKSSASSAVSLTNGVSLWKFLRLPANLLTLHR
jgi:hypothetical protein